MRNYQQGGCVKQIFYYLDRCGNNIYTSPIMKPKENQDNKLFMTPSPTKHSQPPHISNPESNPTYSGKRRLSPSNSADTPDLKPSVKRKDSTKQQNMSPSALREKSSSSRQEKREQIERYEVERRVLTEGIEELRKQNMELMENNSVLKNELFLREEDRVGVRRLEEELFRLEREVEGLETEIKQKNNFINVQNLAKEHNSKLIGDMEFEIKEIHHLYDSEKEKAHLLNIKVKRLQEEQFKLKKQVRQLEGGDRNFKETSQSIRIMDRENENLKEKVRVLESINERQKQQISDLLQAIGPRETMMHSTTTSDLKLEVNNELFDNQYSEILQRCLTENDNEEIKGRIVELENTISGLKAENRELKERIGLTRTKNSNRELNDLKLQKQSYEIELRGQHNKLINMNQQLFQMNHENHMLQQQKQHYFEMSQQMESTNMKLAQQLTILYGEKMNYVDRIKEYQEEIKRYNVLKEDHEILEEQYQCMKEENQENQLLIEELNRKNKELLIYVEELRLELQGVNQQLIERVMEVEEMRVSQPRVQTVTVHSRNGDAQRVHKLLKQRNTMLLNSLNKFKEGVMNEMKMMQLELLVAQNTCKGEDSQDIIIKLKRRLTSILQSH